MKELIDEKSKKFKKEKTQLEKAIVERNLLEFAQKPKCRAIFLFIEKILQMPLKCLDRFESFDCQVYELKTEKDRLISSLIKLISKSEYIVESS